MRRRGVQSQIKRALDKRRTTEADNNYRVYVAPFGARGLHQVKDECNEEVKIVSGPARTFAPGAIVPTGSNTGRVGGGEFILTEPPPGRRGGATFGTLYPSPSSLDVAAITSASPSTLEIGTSNNAVTLTGYGFVSGDDVSAVVWDSGTAAWTADPYITVDTEAYVSAVSMTCQIDVASTCPVNHPINLRIVR